MPHTKGSFQRIAVDNYGGLSNPPLLDELTKDVKDWVNEFGYDERELKAVEFERITPPSRYPQNVPCYLVKVEGPLEAIDNLVEGWNFEYEDMPLRVPDGFDPGTYKLVIS